MAWRLLEKWARRDQATIVCHKVYTFRSLLAEKWLELIAGDAAQRMLPVYSFAVFTSASMPAPRRSRSSGT